jgi:CRP/FNR family transcriptional regulator, dissimilatory nitrate respiration regulator
MFKRYNNIVSKMDLFNSIDKDEISVMLDCLKPKFSVFKKNEYIITAGDRFDSIGIVLNGQVTISKENAAGSRVVMSVLGQGEMFGEMVAFSSRSKWPATVQAQETCEILFLPRDKIVGECSKLCSSHRILIQNFLRIISERALMLNKKVEYLTIRSMRGKISTYLLEQYKMTQDRNIMLPLKRNELADFLNVSRPSMSREMCKMRDEGVIDFHLSAFRILDFEALKAMSTL